MTGASAVAGVGTGGGPAGELGAGGGAGAGGAGNGAGGGRGAAGNGAGGGGNGIPGAGGIGMPGGGGIGIGGRPGGGGKSLPLFFFLPSPMVCTSYLVGSNLPLNVAIGRTIRSMVLRPKIQDEPILSKS
ncbi:MAG: hypothetical protein CMA11_00230 [Euryarchaeota archaeon]|nr:hypothetical protein [Euryarchaeota archaeon]